MNRFLQAVVRERKREYLRGSGPVVLSSHRHTGRNIYLPTAREFHKKKKPYQPIAFLLIAHPLTSLSSAAVYLDGVMEVYAKAAALLRPIARLYACNIIRYTYICVNTILASSNEDIKGSHIDQTAVPPRRMQYSI